MALGVFPGTYLLGCLRILERPAQSSICSPVVLDSPVVPARGGKTERPYEHCNAIDPYLLPAISVFIPMHPVPFSSKSPFTIRFLLPVVRPTRCRRATMHSLDPATGLTLVFGCPIRIRGFGRHRATSYQRIPTPKGFIDDRWQSGAGEWDR